ncbi:MAG: hypothetical protein IKQ61_04470 [Spirochaetales bacterium]|jgi:hypothetical protein|nr:hypothetical protein [Spirochaetales bacterium]
MKKIVKNTLLCLSVLLLACSCKSMGKVQYGSFSLMNYSDKTIEFIWIAPEGTFFQTAQEINIGYGEDYELLNLEPGVYDIAIDFKGEYNSFNSKKDKSLVLKIERGMRKIWIVDTDGKIVID